MSRQARKDEKAERKRAKKEAEDRAGGAAPSDPSPEDGTSPAGPSDA